jgi:hypothetical protein
MLAPYETYLRTCWREGERNGVGLWRDLVARGYTGSRMTVERFFLGLRAMEQQGLEISQAATTVEMTPHRAVKLLLLHNEERTEEERTALRQVRQDQAAVQAGLVLKWNNGMVEGHINRLKFLKRSMDGRANFNLLRLRVLHQRK